MSVGIGRIVRHLMNECKLATVELIPPPWQDWKFSPLHDLQCESSSNWSQCTRCSIYRLSNSIPYNIHILAYQKKDNTTNVFHTCPFHNNLYFTNTTLGGNTIQSIFNSITLQVKKKYVALNTHVQYSIKSNVSLTHFMQTTLKRQ